MTNEQSLQLAGWVAGCAGAGLSIELVDEEPYRRGYARGEKARKKEITNLTWYDPSPVDPWRGCPWLASPAPDGGSDES
jgi:hypothetical protein